MNIIICDAVADAAVGNLKKAGYNVDVKTGLTPEELNKIIENYDGVIVRSATKIRKEQIGHATKLKVIARGGVGVDNIDVDYAKSKGIHVVNTPAATSISVAELTIGMMFGLVRFLALGDSMMKAGEWEKKALAKGTELFGKTLAILGIGRIGQEVAKRAHALGMNVVFYDEIEFPVTGPYTRVSFEQAISSADFITVHTPKTKGYLIGKPEFKKMKKGVYLNNCARGGVVDEKELILAIKEGIIAGAGIDVWEEEPTKNQELVNLPQVITLPHLGASTEEGQTRAGIEVADRVISVLKGDLKGCL